MKKEKKKEKQMQNSYQRFQSFSMRSNFWWTILEEAAEALKKLIN